VLIDQVPRLAGPYDVGCVYVGVNDTRWIRWNAADFERDARAIVAALAASCERVLVVAPPHDLGRPAAAPKPAEAGAVLHRVAAESGAVLCDLARFGGRRNVLPDVVHPTSAGELAIADAAAAALGVPRRPSEDAEPRDGALDHARFEAWRARLWAGDVVRRARERRRFRRLVG
jgi:hypothetical protein